jgi:hypothetical protein
MLKYSISEGLVVDKRTINADHVINKKITGLKPLLFNLIR